MCRKHIHIRILPKDYLNKIVVSNNSLSFNIDETVRILTCLYLLKYKLTAMQNTVR